MIWPFNYPGDEYSTNVFNQVIILLEDVKDKAVEFIDELKGEFHTNEIDETD